MIQNSRITDFVGDRRPGPHGGRRGRPGVVARILAAALTWSFAGAAATAQEIDVLGARAANQAAMVKYRKKDFGDALAAIRRAVALHPDNPRYQYNLACFASLAGELKTAREALAALVALPDPEAQRRVKKALTDPDLAAARQDPTIAELLQRGQPTAERLQEADRWSPLLPGFAPLAVGKLLDGAEAAAARQLLGPAPADSKCLPGAVGAHRIFRVSGDLDPQRPGEERVYAALDSGVVVVDAKGQRVATLPKAAGCAGGSEDSLDGLALGRLSDRGTLDLVLDGHLGDPGQWLDTTWALRLAGGGSDLFAWVREASEVGLLGTLVSGLPDGGAKQRRALRLEAPGLLSLRDGSRPQVLRYDAQGGRFQDVTPTSRPLAKAAPKAKIKRPPKTEIAAIPPVPTFVQIQQIRATSVYADKKRPQRYAADNVLFYDYELNNEGGTDGYASMWCEGKADEGVGESVTVTLATATRIDKIAVAAGVHKSDRLFAANNRITRLEVIADGRPPLVVVLPKTRELVEIPVGGAPVSALTLRVAAVKKGRLNDTCLSAVDLFRGSQRLSPVQGFDAAALAALPRALGEMQYELEEGPDVGRMKRLFAFPFTYTDEVCVRGGGCPGETVVHATPAAVVKACDEFFKIEEDMRWEAVQVCPDGANVDPEDDRPLTIETEGKDGVAVTFPSHNELCKQWRLVWGEGRWRLKEIGYNNCYETFH